MYLPLYAFGVYHLRSLAWNVATAGILLLRQSALLFTSTSAMSNTAAPNPWFNTDAHRRRVRRRPSSRRLT